MGAQIHAVPAVITGEPCEVAVRPTPAHLRPYVLGWSGFRSGSGGPLAHLVLPLASTSVVIDFGSPSGLVSGARDTATTAGDTTWGHGVSVGLTPLGVAALFGVPMKELGGGVVPLADLLGPVATELPGVLGAASGWEERFLLLEAVLTAALGGGSLAPDPVTAVRNATSRRAGSAAPGGGVPCAMPGPAVMAAWWRLQRPGCPAIGALAEELGVSRRRLERGFRQHVGLSPATVARIARFQRAVSRFGAGAAPADAAADSGFADHAHLARETRSMAGLTPTGLAAHLSMPPVVVSQTYKTPRDARP